MRFLIGIWLSSAAVLFSRKLQQVGQLGLSAFTEKMCQACFKYVGNFTEFFHHKDKQVITSTITDIDRKKIE